MTPERMVEWATAAATLLGALPAPTSVAITALQTYMVVRIARRMGMRVSARDAVLASPIVARSAGIAAWCGLMKAFGPSIPFGMVAGGAIAGVATHAIGRAALEHYQELEAGPHEVSR